MQTASLLLAVGGNFYLAGLFALALLFPAGRADFIFGTGMLFFVIEFLGLHSSGMLEGLSQEESSCGVRRRNLTLVGMYWLFALGMALGFHNWYIPFTFALSVLAKYFGRKASPGQTGTTVRLTLLFLGTVFLTVVGASWISRWFPFSAEILSHRLPKTSGLFVTHPQALLVWGVLYYFSAALIEIRLFFKSRPAR